MTSGDGETSKSRQGLKRHPFKDNGEGKRSIDHFSLQDRAQGVPNRMAKS